MENATSTYFREGFDLCKKQIGLLHLDLNIQDIQTDFKLVKEDWGEEKDELDANPPSK